MTRLVSYIAWFWLGAIAGVWLLLRQLRDRRPPAPLPWLDPEDGVQVDPRLERLARDIVAGETSVPEGVRRSYR